MVLEFCTEISLLLLLTTFTGQLAALAISSQETYPAPWDQGSVPGGYSYSIFAERHLVKAIDCSHKIFPDKGSLEFQRSAFDQPS